MRFRKCTECKGRYKPKEGRYCYLAPVEGHRRWDWICEPCRRLIASEKRQADAAERRTRES